MENSLPGWPGRRSPRNVPSPWEVTASGLGLISTGVHDPLFTKALFLQQGENRVCIITADLISIPDAVFKRVLTYLMKEGIIDDDSLCICASHTHSGPDVEESLIIASPTREYLERLIDKMILAAKTAAGKLQPIEVRIATGQADFLDKPAIGHFRSFGGSPGSGS